MIFYILKIICIMAKTDSSTRGKQKKKIIPVKPHKRDGKKVSGHRRSTPQ